MTRAEIRVGDQLTWMHQPRGGYCVPMPVDAEVISTTQRRIVIQVRHRRLGMVTRVVRPEHLRPRGAP